MEIQLSECVVNFFLTFLASLFSPTEAACRVCSTVHQLRGKIVSFLFHRVNTEEKQRRGSFDIISIVFSSESFRCSWIPTSLHLLGMLAATRFMRSRSSGSVDSSAGHGAAKYGIYNDPSTNVVYKISPINCT